MKKYYEEAYANKLYNLVEMKKFQKTHKLPTLTQHERKTLVKPITNNVTQLPLLKTKLNKNKRPVHMASLENFTTY
jgi:hypothetical protein